MKKIYSAMTSQFIDIALLTVFYALSFWIGKSSNFASGFIMIALGLISYFYFSVRKPVNYLRLSAVFSGVWSVTIGLAQFKFLAYQHTWLPFTWFCVYIAHVIFLLMNRLGQDACDFALEKNHSQLIKTSNFRWSLSLKNERLFWVSMSFLLVGLVSFVANVLIKGYIPFFIIDEYPNAYFDFYTRFQIFIVASLSSAGLSFYCLKNLKLPKWKRILLWTSIFLLVFVLPILLVQRGTFLNVALMLTAVVYLGGNRKFITLVTCVLLMGSIYIFGSVLRGYSDTQLTQFFPPKVIPPGQEEQNLEVNDSLPFTLPPQVLFLYSYLTVSHDNFNSAVEHKTVDTMGVWQLRPFNVVLRNTALKESITKAEEIAAADQVLPHLNSFNLISFAYYDFGIIGVIVFMGLWSFAFGVVEMYNERRHGVFSSIVYGICLIPVGLGFFLPWMSDFVPWLLWGSVLIMFLMSSLSFRKSLKNQNG